MRTVRLIISLITLFSIFNSYAQKKRNVQSYLYQIENVQIFNFLFLMPELNKVDIKDSSFFKRYKKSINRRINFGKTNKIPVLSNIELSLIHKNLDTIINSNNKFWNKEVFKKIKSLTPISNDTLLNELTIKRVFEYSSDETNVEDIIFYTLLIFNSEKVINFCLMNKDAEIKLKNWEEKVFPFGSCDYLPYKEILNREKQYFNLKYQNTKNIKLKSMIKNIQTQEPDC